MKTRDSKLKSFNKICRARAVEAVTSMQKRPTRTGAGKLNMKEIDREVAAIRFTKARNSC